MRLPQRRGGAARRSAADGVDRRREPWPRRSYPRKARRRVRVRMGRAACVAARLPIGLAPGRTATARGDRADRRSAAGEWGAGVTAALETVASRLVAPEFAAGTVWLVGAGPGDPGLLTLHAAHALAVADVVLHDALVSPDVLALAPRARLESVGKRAGGERTPQLRINERLI